MGVSNSPQTDVIGLTRDHTSPSSEPNHLSNTSTHWKLSVPQVGARGITNGFLHIVDAEVL